MNIYSISSVLSISVKSNGEMMHPIEIQILQHIVNDAMSHEVNPSVFFIKKIEVRIPQTTKSLRITCTRCIPLNSRSKTRQRATLLLFTLIYFCRLGGMVNFTLPLMTNVTISISTQQNFPFLSSNIPTSHTYEVFLQLIRYARACSSHGCLILRAT